MARKSKYQSAAALQPQMPFVCSRAGHYGRLSVEDGDDIDKNSIGNQRKIAEKFVCERDDIIITEYYSDNGYSGMNYNRPGFQRMMEDLNSGKIDCVIVKDISRFGRHFIMTSEYVERTLPAMGIRLICINDNYDSFDKNADTTSLLLPIKMMMNDNYVRDISRKIRSGIHAKMNSGTYLPATGSIPYGYLRNSQENTYDPDPVTAPVVLRIFQLRAAGEKFNAIARILNADGISCPGRLRYERGINRAEKFKNALWVRATIRKITNDQVYIGNRVHGKIKREQLGFKKKSLPESAWTVVENTHPAIVPTELFHAVQTVNQQELAARATFGKRADAGVDYRALLRDKVICGDCGSAMFAAKGCARANAKTPSRIFFDCSSYKYSNHTRCCSHYIRQEILVKAVTDLIEQQIAAAVDVESLIGQIKNDPTISKYLADANDRLTSIRVKKGNVQAKQEQLVVHRVEGLINDEEFEALKAKYNQEFDCLLKEETTVIQQGSKLELQLDSTKKWIRSLKHYQKAPILSHDLLDMLIDKIQVYGDKRIRIILKFEDPFAPFMEFITELKEADRRVG